MSVELADRVVHPTVIFPSLADTVELPDLGLFPRENWTSSAAGCESSGRSTKPQNQMSNGANEPDLKSKRNDTHHRKHDASQPRIFSRQMAQTLEGFDDPILSGRVELP
jgi:hypothetical protein